jgi:hypothetical protein
MLPFSPLTCDWQVEGLWRQLMVALCLIRLNCLGAFARTLNRLLFNEVIIAKAEYITS